MKKRMFVVFMVVLPVFVLIGGCGGGSSSGEYPHNPNNETIIHYDVDVTDWAAIQRAQNERQWLLQEQSRQTMKSMYDTIDSIFGIPPRR